MSMWQVKLETLNFVFEAYGETEEQANEAMGRALTKHAEQYGIDQDWWADYDFSTCQLFDGWATRNGQPL